MTLEQAMARLEDFAVTGQGPDYWLDWGEEDAKALGIVLHHAKLADGRAGVLAAIVETAHDYDQTGPATDNRFATIEAMAREAP